jgi:hypothetical protein
VEPPKGDFRCLGRFIAFADDPLFGVGFLVFLASGVDFLGCGVGSKA